MESVCICVSDNVKYGEDETHCSQILVNEILCFLWSQPQAVPLSQLYKVCDDFFDNKEVLIAKNKLISLLLSELNSRPRQGQSVSKNFEDIVQIFNS